MNNDLNKLQTDNLYNDALAKKVVRFLLVFQASTLIVGSIFTLTKLNGLALFMAFITLVVFWGALFWAFIRYQTYSIVKEKNRLNKKSKDLKAQITTNSNHIQRAKQKREELKREEQAEKNATLITSQKEYIRSGMSGSKIENADIPGIGHGLKQRLAMRGFTSAESITSLVTSVEGFGPAKSQAMINWRNRILSGLNASKPTIITPVQEKIINDKYNALQATNTNTESKHLDQKIVLEKTLEEIQPRIQELTSIGFGRYLGYALHSRGLIAGLVASGLIFTLVCLGTTPSVGAIMASLPTPTFTPTLTRTLTKTFTPTITNTPTISDTPTITFTSTTTDTPTVTFTPSLTFTPSRTPTQTPSKTLTRTMTRTPLPYVPPVQTVIPPPVGNCDPSYPTVCIPPPPPDLNCGDIPYRNFTVLPPDPHHFDGNHDGIGCQS